MIKTTFYVYDVDPDKEGTTAYPKYLHHLIFHVEEHSVIAINLKKADIIKSHPNKFVRQEGEQHG